MWACPNGIIGEAAQKKKIVDRYLAFKKEKMANRRLAGERRDRMCSYIWIGSICRADTPVRVCKVRRVVSRWQVPLPHS